jgi:hypothetical protein
MFVAKKFLWDTDAGIFYDMKLILLLLPILSVSILQCKMPAPADFWEKYETAVLVKIYRIMGLWRS